MKYDGGIKDEGIRYEGVDETTKLKKKTLIILGIVLVGIIIGIFIVLNKTPDSLIINSELENDAGRYFLSEVELIEDKYSPALGKCLVDEKGNEIYNQWSTVYFPSSSPYEVALMRIELKEGASLNETCFIKEIITEKEWQEVKGEYNFSKEKIKK